jgi:SAM-dependent methyltransferase
MESFGFEWNTFEDYANDNFDAWVAPLRPEFFRGKIGVDAGCGGGRHALKAHSYGAEVVAMDLSPAVDAAYRKARTTDGVHVIQGDIFNPPLAPAAFDFVYSLGVLHHTPDPPRAFRSLVPLLRPGGTIAVMLYARGRRMILGALALVRAVSTRLPLPVTRSVAWSLAALDTCGPIAGYRALRRIGVPAALLDRVTPEHVRLYAGLTFRICQTDWLDRLSYPYVHYYSGDDLARWFAGAGLASRAIRPLGGHGWVGLAETGGAATTAAGAPSASAVLERTA